LRAVLLRMPRRNASARRRGSGRAKRAAMRACKRSNSWVHRTTSVRVVLGSDDLVGESGFKFFSFHMDDSDGEVTLPECHIVNRKEMKFGCFFLDALLAGLRSATVVAKREQHTHWPPEKPLEKPMGVRGRCKCEW
jgi:hypothetical protein